MNIPVKNNKKLKITIIISYFYFNKKLKKIIKMTDKDIKLQTLWECSNIMVMDRMGYSDHGPTHVAIVSNIALKLIRNLIKSGIEPNVVKDYELTEEDAEIIVVLGAFFHDVGNSIHRYNHENNSITLALPFLDKLLDKIYDEKSKQIMICEILHCITSHDSKVEVLTIEAGVVKFADALDMTEGRARIPFERGKKDIYAVSALSIDEVKLSSSKDKPIKVDIIMNNSAGIFQVDNLLKNKLRNSPIEKYVSVTAKVKEGKEKKIIKNYELK